ncbi:MAG: hypothetical protein WA687_09400 [Solirubrobacterales bacterium]
MRGLGIKATLAICAALICCALTSAPASAEFGINNFDVKFSEEDSTPGFPLDDPPLTQAGAHPFAVTTYFGVNFSPGGNPWEEFVSALPDERLRDLIIEQPAGLTGDATAVPRCSTTEFIARTLGLGPAEGGCEDSTAVGAAGIFLLSPPPSFTINNAIYNLEPPPGVAVRLGFVTLGIPTIIDIKVKQGGEYNVIGAGEENYQGTVVFGGVIQLWGVPADPAHDPIRGSCLDAGFSLAASPADVNFEEFAFLKCPTDAAERPLLNLPGSCVGPVETKYQADSWTQPGRWLFGGSISHDNAAPPNPIGFSGCGKLNFNPSIESTPTSDSAETGTGLDFNVDFPVSGLTNPDGLVESQTKKAVVTLPEGVTINPSIGEGLGICTPADLARETLSSEPGEGCPNPSKLGILHVDTPIVDEGIEGAVYLAQQDDPGTTTPGAENPFDSLIALYLVVKNPKLGFIAKLPMLVEPDPQTGRLVTTLDDIPQFPFNHFNFHFKEGVRAALVTPPACGTYTTEAQFYPRSDPSNPRTILSDFQITRGKGGGSCPPGGIPPFAPDFEAGSINNNAGSFSPFNMRLLREDGEQNMTKFSSVLPPGVLGSLAGVSKCPDSAVDVAKAKTAREELASTSCPANSLIGHTLAGAGVGSALTYVKGYVYLGGPYKGAPLSVISVTPALAGPFDAGTVVVRLGLDLNPKTAEVEVDGAASDPIPHILKGIVLKVRDLRVYVDRPNFTLNPTSCDESSAKATLFGSYLNVLDPADDVPAALSTRYQAANCLNLGFKPKLALNLKGGTKRGGHPGLTATYTPRKGDANVEGLVVRLPRSAFLDQAHIKTICTRVQFAADACPENARYGFIRAWTPLLEEPLAGPVWLRSSNHKLPDLVFDLHGLVDVEVSTRIDSAKGGIRATVENSPDAPLSKVVLRMQGAKKGLIVNSRDLCAKKSKANVQFSGHNGKQLSANPVMRAQCGGKGKAK